jgi:long-chain acyl-CoA synthetase
MLALIISGGYNAQPARLRRRCMRIPSDGGGGRWDTRSVPSARKEAAVVKERVAGHKYPRKARIVDELPRGATGKIQRRDIRVHFEEGVR